MKHTPPPFLFPERCLSLSVRCLEKPGGWTDISREIHVSVTMLQSLSLWKATFAQILSTLFSRDWAVASSIGGVGDVHVYGA